MRKVFAIIIVMLVMLGVFAAGCTSPVESPTTTQSQPTKLVIGTTAQVDNIGLGDSTMMLYRLSMFSPGLVRVAADGSIVGVLAESWETTNNQNWTFHLVKNATFQDGTPVTANDIKFTLQYMPNVVGGSYKSEWQLIDSIETPDNYTVVINLKKPWAEFLTNLLIMRTLPQHIYQNVDSPKNFTDPRGAIGCGPYQFVSFDKDAGVVTFKAYDNYFGGKPAIDTIEIRSFKNADTMVMALQNGQIDTTYIYAKSISYYYIPSLLQNDNIKFMTIKNLGIPMVLWINNNVAPYDDPKFREALSHAINYDELKNLFAAGYGSTPNGGFVPEGTYNYIDTPPLTYDVNLTKQILRDSGYKMGADGYFEYPNGTHLQLNLLADGGNPDEARLSQVLTKYFTDAGIDVRDNVMDSTSYDTATFDAAAPCPDMFLYGTTYFGMQAWGEYGSSYMDSRMYYWANITDPKYEAIVDGLLSTSDKDQRTKLAADIQNYYAEENPSLALYWNNLVQPYNKKYEGYVAGPMFGILSYETFYNLHPAK